MEGEFSEDRAAFMERCMKRVDRITLICLCSDRNITHFRQTEALINRVERVRRELHRGREWNRGTLDMYCKWIGRLEKEAGTLIISRRGTFHLSLEDGDCFMMKGKAADRAEGIGAAAGMDGEGLACKLPPTIRFA